MSNPKVTQKSITSLTIKGFYSRDGVIDTDDDMKFHILELLAMFHGSDIKLTCKSEINEDEE